MGDLSTIAIRTAIARRTAGGRAAAAFTLIEMMVATVVLAVLSVLVFGLINEARYRAREVQSASNIRQLAAANLAYAATYGRFAPDSDGDSNGFRTRWFGSRETYNMREPYSSKGGYLSEYLEGGKVRYCPVLDDMFRARPSLVGTGYFEKESGGYGYNSAYIGRTPQEIADAGKPPAPGTPRPQEIEPGEGESRQPGNLTVNVQDPARTVMFTSTAIAGSGGGIVETAESVAYVDYKYGFSMTPTTHFRFRGRALVAWADGHVTFEQPNDSSTDWNVYHGNNEAFRLGWFGPTDYNGYWNPRRGDKVLY